MVNLVVLNAYVSPGEKQIYFIFGKKMAYRIKVLDQFIHAINSHKVISDILGIQISSSIYNPLLYVQIAATFLAPEEKNW